MTPTLGRTLIYVLSENDAAAINRRRTDGKSIAARMTISLMSPNGNPPGLIYGWPAGAQAHIGNTALAGQEFPGVVVKVVRDDCVNLQVFLDGNDVFWAQSAMMDASKSPLTGSWHWPARE